MAKMVIEIGAKIDEMKRKLADAGAGIRSFWKGIGTAGRFMVGGGLTAFTGGLVAAVKHSAELAAKFEQSRIAFEVMVGSASRAAKLIEQMREFSDRTPFSSDKVLEAARTLLSFGSSAESVAPTLKMLGDISAGTGKDLAELAVIFGQIKSTGRLMGGDLLQLINAGFNPLTEIAKATGKSMLELKQDMEKGLITFDMVEAAFKSATSEGGLFFQMTEKQAQTLNGQLSTLRDSMDRLAQGFGGSMLPELKLMVAEAQKLADTFTAVAEARQRIASGEVQGESPIAPSLENFGARFLEGVQLLVGEGDGSLQRMADKLRESEMAKSGVEIPGPTPEEIAAKEKAKGEDKAASVAADIAAFDKTISEGEARIAADQAQAAKDMDAGFVDSPIGRLGAMMGKQFRGIFDRAAAEKEQMAKAQDFAQAGAADALESRKAQLQENAAMLERDLSSAFRPAEFIQSSLARIGGERGIAVSRQSPEVGELQKVQAELKLIEKAIKENGVARWP